MPKWTTEQLEAIEKQGSNIIVSAGAGSGKTAVLSERVIYKLEQGIHIGELLILTFTRAAAEEMKDRIRKKMKENPKFKDEVNALDSAYITTFDSFALSTVKKCHYLLDLPQNISITDESIVKIKKAEFLNQTFEEYYGEGDVNFLKLVDKYCVKNDNTLRSSIAELALKIGNLIDYEEFLFSIKNDFFNDENIEKLIKEYSDFISEKKKIVNLELENTCYYFDENYNIKLQNLILPILNTSSLEELCKYNSVKLPTVPRGTDDEAKNVKSQLKDALDELLSYARIGSEQKIKDDILLTQEYVFTIVDIIVSYLQKLTDYKRENNIYTFQDIATLAIRILEENEVARNELKFTFKEIMIDEYQDTNDIQERFIGLISNNNVYMVGDIKQSIYRFRGSNPNIFKEKYDNYSQNNGGIKIDLIKNFRSRSEVLKNINDIFDLIMDNDLGGAEYYESHEMVYGNTDYNEKKLENYNYNLEVLEYQNSKETGYSNQEIEIFAIAKDIQNKFDNKLEVYDKELKTLRPIKYSDFVIILDRSQFFDDFKKIFEFLNIPLTILKDGKLNSSTDILIIKNIVDFIIRIQNKDFGIDFKYDFLSIGRSFLYEYDDEYLFEVLTENKFLETKLYNDFANIKNYNSKTSTEIFEEILSVTNFYQKINKIGDYENINVRLSTIYDLTLSLSNLGMDIEDFRDYLNEIITSNYEIKYTTYNDSSDSVKILTIHKSKGLEYPICYFADLDHNFNLSDLKSKFLTDKKYGIITPVDSEDTTDNIMKILFKNSYIKEEIGERIRLFYVALTRAREKMIVVIPEKDTIKLEKNRNGTIELIRRLNFRKLSDLIYSVKDYFPNYFKKIEIDNLGLTKNYLYNKPYKNAKIESGQKDFEVNEIFVDNSKLEERSFSKELPTLISRENKKNMEFGTKVHEILECIDFVNFDVNDIENKFIANKISKFLEHPLFQNIKNASVYKEYEFTYKSENVSYRGVIDLMLEYDNHIDIVDYKLKNTGDEAYVKQLTGYKNYIQSISNKSVDIYLYSILESELIKIEN